MPSSKLLVVVAAFAAACANAKPGGGPDLGNGDGGGHDLAAPDLSSPDLRMPDLERIPDLQVVCSTDANERLCGSKCLTPTQCCVASDCPIPPNGSPLCGPGNLCGVSCNTGYKACGPRCIPNANCCVDGDCTTAPDNCHKVMGATCGPTGVCNYPAVVCPYGGQSCNTAGLCVCPTGQHVCQRSASCIPDGTCCIDADCSAIAGQVCPAAGSNCTCLSGFQACVITGTFSQCILATSCCTSASCTVSGQSCTGPGGTCQCGSGQKVCGSSCIPNANCCVDNDCASMGTGELCVSGTCQCPTGQRLCSAFRICIPTNTCCVDGDCPTIGQRCSGIGGSCACPSGQHQCVSSGTCISNSNCCQTSECSVSGQTCVGGPPGTCACGGGSRVCTTTNTCIPSSTCCVASDCLPPPNTHVTASACNGNTGGGGTCAVSGCNGGWFDINRSYSDGCECPDTVYGTSCGGATGLGTLGYSDSRSVTSQLPASGTEDAWFLVNFPSNGSNPSTAYHPHIGLTQGVGEYVFDVLSDCGGTLAFSCNTGGDAPNPLNLINFDVKGGGDYGTQTYNAVPNVGNNGQVYIRVHRSNTTTVSCNPFTLVISD